MRKSLTETFEQQQGTSTYISEPSTSRKSPIHGMCFKCARTVGLKQKGFECSTCNKLYHERCIPKEHQIHIPDDSDDDLFVCHGCFPVEDDSDDGIDESVFSNINNI